MAWVVVLDEQSHDCIQYKQALASFIEPADENPAKRGIETSQWKNEKMAVESGTDQVLIKAAKTYWTNRLIELSCISKLNNVPVTVSGAAISIRRNGELGEKHVRE